MPMMGASTSTIATFPDLPGLKALEFLWGLGN